MGIDKRYIIGIDIGGTKMAYGLFDIEGDCLDACRYSTDRDMDGDRLVNCLVKSVTEILERNNLNIESLIGLGIGMPSYILFDEGYILMTTNLTGIKNYPLKAKLEQIFHIPVLIDNDSNLAALAEARRGAGRGWRHMLYCAVSTGISNGLIIDGRLFRGSYGWAGESGHALITPDEGILCGCENRGCFMSHVSGSMISRWVKQELDKGRSSSIRTELDQCGGQKEPDAVMIKKAAEQGDPLGVEAINHMAFYMGVWLYNCYQFYNINLFVFGGGLLNFGPLLFDKVKETFARYDRIKLPVYFKEAELTENFGIIGACELFRAP